MIGSTIRLIGKSAKGKQIIKQQGELWQVVNDVPNDSFKITVPGLLICPSYGSHWQEEFCSIKGKKWCLIFQSKLDMDKATSQKRWIEKQDDQDFICEFLSK